MDGDDRFRRRRSLQERLGLKGMVCCGSTWGLGPSTMSIRGDDDDDDAGAGDDDLVDVLNQRTEETDEVRILPDTNSDPDCIVPSPRMNLAAALAAERHSRPAVAAVDGGDSSSVNDENDERVVNTSDSTATRGSTGTPARMSLMRLLEETDDQDEKGTDLVCCVCMGRKKGAAFIPCGHTFCRVCSRELWLNRGSCPLCNRSIIEILDIY